MKAHTCLAAASAAVLFFSSAHAADQPVSGFAGLAAPAVRPPAQYKASGSFSGGGGDMYIVISAVRFGKLDDGATRIVLDLDQYGGQPASRKPAQALPAYSVELLPYPYRLVIRMGQTTFESTAPLGASGALPLSIISTSGGPLKEMQVFLGGPSEFKVIEIDGPAKLCIDVRPLKNASAPEIWTVQLTAPKSVQDAYALVEQGKFPEGFHPQALVLGNLVVVEQAFTDPASAAQMDASLRQMGYASVINERRGDELPQR